MNQSEILKQYNRTFAMRYKNPGFITSIYKLGEELPGLHCKGINNMEYGKLLCEFY